MEDFCGLKNLLIFILIDDLCKSEWILEEKKLK